MKKILIIASLICFLVNIATAQEPVILKAMKEELKRNIENLKLEKLRKPFFISYTIADAKALQINASLGSVILSEEKQFRKQENTVLVGDNTRTCDNYLDENTIWFWERDDMSIPLGNDVNAIKRALWLVTDHRYKTATAKYEAKISSIQQQNLADEEKNLADFSTAPQQKLILQSPTFTIDKAKLENTAKELSAIMKTYNDIFSSGVNIFVYQADVYFTNTDLSEVKYPAVIVALQAYVKTQASDGEPLADHVFYYTLSQNDLPSMEIMKKDIKTMADNITALRKAPVIAEAYSGPVLFEGEAAAEILVQKFFSGTTSLVGNRKPILSNPTLAQMAGDMYKDNGIEPLLNKKLVSRDLTIKAIPGLKEYNGIKLVGSYEIDAEGVKPDKELVLVDNGVLKNLLNDRVPSTKVLQSNGHKRFTFNGGGISTVTGPGVISFTTSKGMTKDELMKKMFAAAKEEDLEYVYIVRKIKNLNAGIPEENEMIFFGGEGQEKKDAVSTPFQVYRVSVKDGKEELVRSVEISGLTVKSFKKTLGFSNKEYVYNTLIKGKKSNYDTYRWPLAGIPSSFILPDAILFEELDLQKEKRAVTKKLPVVENPVGK
ncbi:MAG: hypothetical protein A2275_12275 [Bacteroidetes bacterium RIFOXYA12_FULL_35_11]|nr:MAG: hypothetical protein A2X01_01490 [Bacteroidetes bacterium GWF2_35_48]OFY77751.1 MAG: hypothetical protein A2275_12275 [Bacteroidetes bacterium RIFOXYA12_FULL_35_11]OFY92625.1 MAG: hypothetical protein A2491_05320 [Bacteroidetes bacterium RIFOXYC12_FULL_35_7]OFY96585.1 MAG: hypothetical protein A2309_13915 [Bacteroidetes bacterium RIFOXYB2_FULL_35_7]HBX51900.1 hypothetical protein [Bacteroidales bacterium]